MEYHPRVWGGVGIQPDPDLRQEYSSARPENIIINEGVAQHKPHPIFLQDQGQRMLLVQTKPRVSTNHVKSASVSSLDCRFLRQLKLV